MTRREMIEELVERIEGELDELNNAHLSSLLSEFEHTQILAGVIENLNVDDDDTEDDGEDENDDTGLPLIDGDWDEEAPLDEENE